MPPGLPVYVHHGGERFPWLLLLVGFVALGGLAVAGLVRLRRVGGTARLTYASGEIDRDEFARLGTDLGARPPALAT